MIDPDTKARSRVAGTACALLALVAPEVDADRTRPAISLETEEFTLDNGLRVILHQDRAAPTVVVYVWYRVGSKDEVAGKTGFAHLFEHLMFKGSKHVADGQFDKLLEAAGGWNNGTTSADRTNYFEQVPSRYLELALYLEADRMAGLWEAMSQKVLDNQREVVENERRENYDNQPYGNAELLIPRALWPEGHGNRNLTIGTAEDLARATLADVEQFYRRYYVPSNATLVIAGDFDPANTRRLVERYFGWIPERPEPSHVQLTAPVEPRRGEVKLRDPDDVQVPKVLVTWRSPPPFAKDDAELRLAAHILAGGKTSRLYRRLQFDARLAAELYAYQYPQVLGGEFQVSVMARPGVGADQLFAAIDAEVAALARDLVPADELVRAQRVNEADLLQSLESLSVRTDRIAEYAAYTGSSDYLAVELASYRAVTPESLRAAVARWLRPDARVVVYVEPRAEPKEASE